MKIGGIKLAAVPIVDWFELCLNVCIGLNFVVMLGLKMMSIIIIIMQDKVIAKRE